MHTELMGEECAIGCLLDSLSQACCPEWAVQRVVRPPQAGRPHSSSVPVPLGLGTATHP